MTQCSRSLPSCSPQSVHISYCIGCLLAVASGEIHLMCPEMVLILSEDLDAPWTWTSYPFHASVCGIIALTVRAYISLSRG